jgi:hypothetical protein
VNIVTGAGEIGAHSATAANGLYYSSLTPRGDKADPGDKLIGIGDNVKVITISQHHIAKAFFIAKTSRKYRGPI